MTSPLYQINLPGDLYNHHIVYVAPTQQPHQRGWLTTITLAHGYTRFYPPAALVPVRTKATGR